MKLPFTTQQFLEVFRNYNTEVFPLQLVFVMLAALVVFLAGRRGKNADKPILFILSAFWLWMGAVYHIGYFAAINKAAYGFGFLFIIESVLLFYQGCTRAYNFAFRKDGFGFTAVLLILYALIIYPLLGHFLGNRYPFSPTFGLPCPTTIFTIGILLLSQHRLSWSLVAIPVIWSVIGFSAAFTLGIFQDTMLVLAGLLGVILNAVKSKEGMAANTSAKDRTIAAV